MTGCSIACELPALHEALHFTFTPTMNAITATREYVYASAAVVESIVGDVKIVLAKFSPEGRAALEKLFAKPTIAREFANPERHYNWKAIETELEALLKESPGDPRVFVYTVDLDKINKFGKTRAIADGFELAVQFFSHSLRIPLKKLTVRLTRVVYPSVILCQSEKYLHDTYETKFVEWYAFLQFRKCLDLQASLFPSYNWAGNGGRPTKQHVLSILELGPCRLHHKEFIHRLPSCLAKLVIAKDERSLRFISYFERPPRWWRNEESFLDCLGSVERKALEQMYGRQTFSEDFLAWLKANPPELPGFEKYEKKYRSIGDCHDRDDSC